MPKHIPQRTCIACRQAKPKRGLVRVVRAPTGEVTADPTGKKAGRGAYLCAARPCWENALKKHLLEHAFKTPIGDDARAALEAFAATLPASAEAEPAPAKPTPRVLRTKPGSDSQTPADKTRAKTA
jgi:uncharacterized protein